MGEAALTYDGADVIWWPESPKQQLFLDCPVWECMFEGTRGRGATDAMLMDFLQHVGQGYGDYWRGVLFRVAYPDLADVIARSKRWFHRIFPPNHASAAKYNSSDHSWQFATGEALLFRYMDREDDYDRYHGSEFPWIGWEELTSWPNPDCYEAMKSCSRSSLPGIPLKYRSNTNPFGVGHSWVKRYFIDPAPAGHTITDELGRQRVRIHGTFLENPALLRAAPNYAAQLEGQPNAARRKAWLEGDWNVVAGGMFDELWISGQPEIEPFQIPDNWLVDSAHDWGSTKPYATLFYAESNGEEVTLRDGTRRSWPRGTVFVIGEDYGHDENAANPNTGLHLSSKDIVARAKAEEAALRGAGILGRQPVSRGAGDGIWDVRDGRSLADEMAKHGIRWKQPSKGKGSRVTGWQDIASRLAANSKQPMEDPGLFIFSNCRNTIRTVSALPRDKKKPDDVDSNSEDHIGDCLRYRLTATRHSGGEVEVSGI